ncbi:uncharacterized protein LOC131687983 [Topomyia yanbarensis]|uniref:uncharacterized protein LOC131687983 n=1 Tax=Topomyia yanbarensis TaxID=2498891 RepID=UPI00273ACE38|nr:uncharacterized protein LOC131687983 [Topomyia yanbarensis]
MSFFDPLGMLAPYTIHGKMIIQDLWRQGCSWDEKIDDACADKWQRWTAVMEEVAMIKIPRCYFSETTNEDFESLQLHVFTDASENAYGCVAYFRIVVQGIPRCALVAAKSKVAPLKHLSIPRLELQAAVLGSRLANTVLETHSLPVKRRFIWTDSQIVLSWIRSDHKRYSQFVAFRIGEILSQTALREWRWVLTRSNIADVLTKWGSGPPSPCSGEWVVGPDLLHTREENWPKTELPPTNVPEELKAIHLFHEISFQEPLIDTSRFSRWNILVRCIACVYRFLSNCQRKIKGLPIETVPASDKLEKLSKIRVSYIVIPLKLEEYRRAENYLWRIAQREGFGDEVKILLKNRGLPREKWHPIDQGSSLYKRSPLLDEDGVIRMEGRAAYADFIPFELRFPVVLPKAHNITTKLLQHYHQKFGHANRETVVNEVRQRFFIPKLRAAVWHAEKECYWCKVRKCRPSIPRMAPLPEQRLTPHRRPFSHVGLDYFGPLVVTVGRRSEKRWVALFTCLVTRAIHLEVAHSLTSQACMMAIRRFICRRGAPLEVFSDNGTKFQAANKELKMEAKRIDVECGNAFTDARTRWNFNPPAAPHMGGSWERMVRSAKNALKAIHDGRKLNDEILLTVLAEAEDMVNSRPLTYLPQESAENESLTPNHFLRGFPSGEREEANILTDSAEALRDDYKRSQRLADMLWQRWLKEYVPLINHRTKWFEDKEPINEGELVFIVDGDNRRTWVRGIVERIIRGQDGRVRQAMVRTSRGIFRRPVAKLAVMEIKGKSGEGYGRGPELRSGELLAPLGISMAPGGK